MKNLKNITQNLLKKIFDKNILVLVILVTIMLSVLFHNGTIDGHDTYTHLFRIEGMSQNISDLQIPSKIHYNSINGFGYGSGIFYPQLPVLIPAILHNFAKISVSTCLKFGIYIYTLLSAIFMYKFLKFKLRSEKISLMSSIIYTLSPYIFVDSIFRGAIGEMMGFLSLPLTFYGIDLIFSNKNKKGELLLTLGASIIVLSHVITTIYLTIFILFYLLFNIHSTLKKESLVSFFKSLGFIILITLFFTVPLVEHKLIGNYNMLNYRYTPSNSIVYLVQLFFSSGNNNGDKEWLHLNDELPYTINIIIVGILSLLPLIYSRFKSKNDKKNLITYVLLGIIAIVLMCTPWVWDKFRVIDVIQFPWRLLMFSTFFFTLASGYALKYLYIGERGLELLLICIIIISFIQLNPYVISSPIIYDKSIESTVENQIITIDSETFNKSMGGANDYLPQEVTNKYIKTRGTDVIATSGQVSNSSPWIKKGNTFYFSADISKETVLEFPLIYYAGYKITLNGSTVKNFRNNNGFLSIVVPESDNYKIEIKYTGTTYDICSNYISLSALIMFIYIYCIKRKIIGGKI